MRTARGCRNRLATDRNVHFFFSSLREHRSLLFFTTSAFDSGPLFVVLAACIAHRDSYRQGKDLEEIFARKFARRVVGEDCHVDFSFPQQNDVDSLNNKSGLEALQAAMGGRWFQPAVLVSTASSVSDSAASRAEQQPFAIGESDGRHGGESDDIVGQLAFQRVVAGQRQERG